jgi:hypothetical protein
MSDICAKVNHEFSDTPYGEVQASCNAHRDCKIIIRTSQAEAEPFSKHALTDTEDIFICFSLDYGKGISDPLNESGRFKLPASRAGSFEIPVSAVECENLVHIFLWCEPYGSAALFLPVLRKKLAQAQGRALPYSCKFTTRAERCVCGSETSWQ